MKAFFIIKSSKISQHCQQFIGEQNINIISLMEKSRQENLIKNLNNIAFLRIQARPIFIGEKIQNEQLPIYLHSADDEEINSYNFSFIIDDKTINLPHTIINDTEKTAVTQASVGYIEYNLFDFNQNFKPKKLILGNGVYADVYYYLNEIVLEKVPEPIQEKVIEGEFNV